MGLFHLQRETCTTSNMQLFVQGQQIHTLEVAGNESIHDLKLHLESPEGISPADQLLMTGATVLEDVQMLSAYGLTEHATLELSVRMLGGKVHGSLARAGKVKGQTPKVDPQEKKKPKTGRAKRRQQYNSRFVNVVVIPGRRRGPNSNS